MHKPIFGFVIGLLGTLFTIQLARREAPQARPAARPRRSPRRPDGRPILPPGLTVEQARLYAMPCSPVAH